MKINILTWRRRKTKGTASSPTPQRRRKCPQRVFHDPMLLSFAQSSRIPPRLVERAHTDPMKSKELFKNWSLPFSISPCKPCPCPHPTPTSQRLSPHPSHLPSSSVFPSLGGQDKMVTPEAQAWKALPHPPPSSPQHSWRGRGGQQGS